MNKHENRGSSFDDFLEEEGLSAEVAARAAKKSYIYQLEKQMNKKSIKKNAIRKAFKSPATTQRIFGDHIGVTLKSLAKAADVVGCDIEINLVPKKISAG